MSARLITVFGATGQQGAAIVHALLASGFAVRAVTRNPDSEKSLLLKKVGAEIFKGDLQDRSTIESAVTGAYGVFLNTDFWGLLQSLHDAALAETEEIAQGKAVADACVRAEVKHVVYSTLLPAKDCVHHPVHHYDGKALVEKYLRDVGLPTTSLRYPFYYENFIAFTSCKPHPQSDGTYSITLPMDGPMYAMSVHDGGPIAAAIFSNPGEFIGRTVGICGDHKTVHEYAAIIAKVAGKTVTYNYVPADTYAAYPFPGASDLAYMFDFFKKGNFIQDPEITKRLNPKVLNFEEWAERNKDALGNF